jgi:hypothetical protein
MRILLETESHNLGENRGPCNLACTVQIPRDAKVTDVQAGLDCGTLGCPDSLAAATGMISCVETVVPNLTLNGPPMVFATSGNNLQPFRLLPSPIGSGVTLTCQLTACSHSSDYYMQLLLTGVEINSYSGEVRQLGGLSGILCGLSDGSTTGYIFSDTDVSVQVGLTCGSNGFPDNLDTASASIACTATPFPTLSLAGSAAS